jgi:hypothetical protein
MEYFFNLPRRSEETDSESGVHTRQLSDVVKAGPINRAYKSDVLFGPLNMSSHQCYNNLL